MIHRTELQASLPPWAAALSMYDPATAAHSARVGQSARELGRIAGLSRDELDLVALAGVLHDIGKLAVPVDLLTKPGPLTAAEWDVMREHPDEGAAIILSMSKALAPVAEAVRGHHERWDGSGYPQGLRAEQIPLLARIIAIVDVFDAVTHPRCYRSTLFTAEAALYEILSGAGSQFDPALVRLFTEAPLRRHSVPASPARLVAVGT